MVEDTGSSPVSSTTFKVIRCINKERGVAAPLSQHKQNTKERLLMSKLIYIYLKTHNKTGLKYLGKTIQDPYVYKGSGTRWRNHLRKHGNDVSTEILFQSEDAEEIKKIASSYSEKFNIVESKDFANLKPETGEGGFEHINNNSEMRKRVSKISSEWCKKNKFGGNMTQYLTEESRKKMSWSKNKKWGKHTEETKKKMSESHKGIHNGKENTQYGTMWITNEELKKNKKIKKTEPIPNGWRIGRIMY